MYFLDRVHLHYNTEFLDILQFHIIEACLILKQFMYITTTSPKTREKNRKQLKLQKILLHFVVCFLFLGYLFFVFFLRTLSMKKNWLVFLFIILEESFYTLLNFSLTIQYTFILLT